MRRIFQFLAGIAIVGFVGIALLILAVWLEHDRPLELPRPTGPFAVGRMTAGWLDAARLDPYAPSRNQKRELVVWIWYPARPDARSKRAAYYPLPVGRALASHAGILLTDFLNRNPARIQAHSWEDAPLAPDNRAYPVIILRSGIGALALDYTTLAEDLASHGYVVAGCDTPYSTSVVAMPDGRVIHKTAAGNPGDAPVPEAERARLAEALILIWSADNRFLVDQLTRLSASDPSGKFTGRLDLQSLGVMGHSFGGATAAQFCHDDPRCRAGIDLDGRLFGSVVREGLRQPFLFLLSGHEQLWNSPNCDICAQIRSAATRIPGDRLIVTLHDAHHFSSSDQALTKSQIMLKILGSFGVLGKLDSRTGLADVTRYVREFFAVYLRGAPRDPLYKAPLVPAAHFQTIGNR